MSDIFSTTLPSGLLLAVERMPGVRSAAISVVLPAGAAFDPPDRIGRGALWSELLMRGAGSLSSREQADAFDRVGASRAASCAPITFRISGVLLGRALPAALPLFMAMIREPRMSDDAVEPARILALQSIAALQDDPQQRASILARTRHLPAPLNRSALGEEAGIRALTRDDLLRGWHDCARPGGSILAIAGDVEPARVVDLLAPLLDGWAGATPDPTPEAPSARGYHHEHDETSQVQIILLADAPTEHHPHSILEKFRAAVLSGGMASRLFTEVREKRGLCYSVHASYQGDRDFGLFAAYVGTAPDRAQQSLDVLRAELLRPGTPEGRVTQAEFDRAKVGMKSGLIFSGESTSARAHALGADLRRLGRTRTLDELAAEIDAVTLDHLNDYLSTRTLDHCTILTLGPAPLTV